MTFSTESHHAIKTKVLAVFQSAANKINLHIVLATSCTFQVC